MKKIVAIFAVVGLFVSTAVLGDTVKIQSNTSFSNPSGHTITSTGSFAFRGTRDIVLTVAGKTCTLNGSARGSVPMGCNYMLTVAPSGSITGQLTAGNQVCTQSHKIAASCR